VYEFYFITVKLRKLSVKSLLVVKKTSVLYKKLFAHLTLKSHPAWPVVYHSWLKGRLLRTFL